MQTHNLFPRRAHGLPVALALLLAAATVQADGQPGPIASPSVNESANESADTVVTRDKRHQHSERSASDRRLAASVTMTREQRLALTRQYLMDRQYQSQSQQQQENRDYRSAVGQEVGNRGQARGHTLDQQQGGVSVGSLVNESGRDASGAPQGGVSWQYAPQSNSLMLGGDNYAPIQLSNVNANGGNVHIGDVNKGNLYNSQIGNNQQGGQDGDNVNAQSNSQQQQADSRSGSQDALRN